LLLSWGKQPHVGWHQFLQYIPHCSYLTLRLPITGAAGVMPGERNFWANKQTPKKSKDLSYIFVFLLSSVILYHKISGLSIYIYNMFFRPSSFVRKKMIEQKNGVRVYLRDSHFKLNTDQWARRMSPTLGGQFRTSVLLKLQKKSIIWTQKFLCIRIFKILENQKKRNERNFGESDESQFGLAIMSHFFKLSVL